ncbi:hypothetical protein D5H75_07290 [Bailinhaonella thermotolerans]|uniref:Peptidoglycan binding-like domain-containing protein n=2 Tax=Bailinhaonella thermotolerans TaxID=1070861 RepID=A0A3A4BA84_9ACTN|nr:hypothetical protein D5H75_07290 [Bailinhaonella thermotolerans]
MTGEDGRTPPKKAPTSATAEVTRGDLVDTASVGGTLTYADERKVPGGPSGTVTWVPEEGRVIKRGQALYKVDRKPMTLMYGRLPMYRTLRQGVSDGPDVEQLEKNLRALGYGDDMTVDDHFSYATHLAVLEWQDDRGLPETGAVDAKQIVFLPGEVRVADAKIAVGDRAAQGQALTVTSTRRLVHVDLDATKQNLAKKGAEVGIELPDGSRTAGRIAEVGRVAETTQNAQGEEADPTIDVEITLTDPKKAGRLDQAPVTVEMESERRKNVLSVPVEALLALREGGFGLEIVEGASRRVVAVETGVYGGGRVEVSGAGLAEGMRVGVPEQ